MAQLNGLPVFYIKINEDLESNLGIDFVSLVDCPAIEKNWVAMSDTKKPLKFVADQDKQLLAGPILIPDLPIYRYDAEMGEYYVVFTKEEIEKLVRKFQAQQKSINLNYMHTKDSQLKSAVIQEIWLTAKLDKSQTYGFSDLPEGSGFVVAHIGDKKFWTEEVKSGNVRGFSIEGFLDMEMKQIKKNKMQSKFISAKTSDGIEIKSDAEKFEVGVEVYTEAEGVKTPAPDGEHALDNGMTITVEAGKVTAVSEAPTDEEMNEIINAAVKPAIDALRAEMKSQKDTYEAKIKELETKLSNLPAGQSKTDKTDEKKPLTAKQALAVKLAILTKKSKEVTTK